MSGNKQSCDVTVLRTNEYLQDKNDVYFKSFDVLEWSELKNDYVERTLFYDCNFDLDFKENQMLNIIICGNTLLAYEVK